VIGVTLIIRRLRAALALASASAIGVSGPIHAVKSWSRDSGGPRPAASSRGGFCVARAAAVAAPPSPAGSCACLFSLIFALTILGLFALDTREVRQFIGRNDAADDRLTPSLRSSPVHLKSPTYTNYTIYMLIKREGGTYGGDAL
jgi:hypothetical protein